MKKNEKIFLKNFYNSKIPPIFYEKELYNLIILHEEIAGYINQIIQKQKNIVLPNELISQKEINELETLSLENADISTYFKNLKIVNSILTNKR